MGLTRINQKRMVVEEAKPEEAPIRLKGKAFPLASSYHSKRQHSTHVMHIEPPCKTYRTLESK